MLNPFVCEYISPYWNLWKFATYFRLGVDLVIIYN